MNNKILAVTIIVIVTLANIGLAAAAAAPLVITLPTSDMTASERATYQNLRSSAARKSFLDTRGFLRLCQKVVSGRLPPRDLPIEPRDFNDRYVTAEEKKVRDEAIVENVAAILGGGTTSSKSTPPIAGGPVTKAPAITLPTSAMTAAERATYRNLTSSTARKSFLDTRGYLRLCVDVKSGELPALDLPNKPRDFKKGFITSKENALIDRALATHMSAIIDGIRLTTK